MPEKGDIHAHPLTLRRPCLQLEPILRVKSFLYGFLHYSMASETSSTELDLETLLTALPACKRCRKNRRRYRLTCNPKYACLSDHLFLRCDTELYSCNNCTKAGVECIYYDHVLREELPRRYVPNSKSSTIAIMNAYSIQLRRLTG